jgi:hypothetical protein
VEGAILASYKFAGFGKDAEQETRGVLARLQVLVKENELTRPRAGPRRRNHRDDQQHHPRHRQSPRQHAHARDPRRKGAGARRRAARSPSRSGTSAISSATASAAFSPSARARSIRRGSSSSNIAAARKRETPIALVGKAVTFDTGGISIKPGAAMDEMKWDKMGGLAVLGIMLAAADLKLPLNLVGLIPSAENMPGPDAYRPGDIITTRDGKTIEVLNTDAEGRIILADAIAHARLTYKPSAILEYSTLTGAVVMALGHRRAGMFTAQEKLRDAFIAAGKSHRRTRLAMPDRRRIQGTALRNRHGQEHQLPRRMANIFPKGTNETVIKAGLAWRSWAAWRLWPSGIISRPSIRAWAISPCSRSIFSMIFTSAARPRLPLLPQLRRGQRPLQLPTTQTCMNCHRDIQKDNPKLQPVRDSWATGQPIAWVKIHNVPDYAYFNHSAHVNRGVSCVSCHGKVNEMNVVFQHEPQSMGWCLQCHRNPQEFVRPHRRRQAGRAIAHFNLDWTPPAGTTQAELGKKLVQDWKINPPKDCAGCHR